MARQKLDLERRQRDNVASLDAAASAGVEGLTTNKQQLSAAEAALAQDIVALQSQ